MAEFPALPLWTDAFLADCGHLNDAERGLYILILIEMWRAPERRLPNDDEWFARRFRRAVEDVRSQVRPLLREFCQSDGNWWTQKRLTKEFAYLSKQRKQQSDRAKSRWNKDKVVCRGNATTRNAPTPTPTPHTTIDTDVSIVGPQEAPKRERTRSRKRLPQDWEPDANGWAYADEHGCDHTEAGSFRDHHIAKGSLMADWDAAWRTWCRNASRFRAERNGGGNRGGGKGVVAALRLLRTTAAE